jgi:hypothetical protein
MPALGGPPSQKANSSNELERFAKGAVPLAPAAREKSARQDEDYDKDHDKDHDKDPDKAARHKT